MAHKLKIRRKGFSILELMIALGTSSILVAGLASSLYISSQALSMAPTSSQKSRIADVVLHDLTADLCKAIAFGERTSKAVTFAVPDRDGNNTAEIIRYAWSGTPGDPLTYQLNGGAVIDIANDVQDFNLTAITRVMVADTLTTPYVPTVIYHNFTEAKLATDGTNFSIPKPVSTVAGNLLIAVVATDAHGRDMVAPVGWNLINQGTNNDKITLGVWWKIAGATESSSYTFSWTNSEQAYGWIMRFSGHDPVNPISAMAVAQDSSATPLSPAVTTSADNSMIVRLIGVQRDRINLDTPGLSGHTSITMDKSGNGNGTVSGGAGYKTQSSVGDSGTSNFSLAQSANYRAVTIAIAPDANATAPPPPTIPPIQYEPPQWWEPILL